MLKKWSDFVREIDPDIIIGYNIQNFDLTYLIERAQTLKISSQVLKISRIAGEMCSARNATFSSAQMGTRTNKIVDINGRVVFDVYQVCFLNDVYSWI